MGFYLMFIIPPLLLSIYAQFKVKSTFKKYSNVRSARGVTGKDVAQTLLRNNGISQVNVESIGGNLTDHYDPRSHTLRLSETVYGNNSIAAIGVAAHEVGHAIQHQQQYGPLELRHSLVPVTNFASSAAFPILLIGMVINQNELYAGRYNSLFRGRFISCSYPAGGIQCFPQGCFTIKRKPD